MNEIAPAANVTADDFQAVHRLKKKDNVIIKFVSRRKKHQVIIKKGKLKEQSVKDNHNIEGSIYLNESMCNEVKKLFYLCKKLKGAGKLEFYTFFNGSIRVKTEKEGNSHMIGHISDLV